MLQAQIKWRELIDRNSIADARNFVARSLVPGRNPVHEKIRVISRKFFSQLYPHPASSCQFRPATGANSGSRTASRAAAGAAVTSGNTIEHNASRRFAGRAFGSSDPGGAEQRPPADNSDL
jgi:hypothetical protein